MKKAQKIAVIGGGAAGFFAAIAAKQHWPNAAVCILEKSNKVLAKVKISGGGRCNVTHNCPDISELAKAYPRGGSQLRKAFHQFAANDTISWFDYGNCLSQFNGRFTRGIIIHYSPLFMHSVAGCMNKFKKSQLSCYRFSAIAAFPQALPL